MNKSKSFFNFDNISYYLFLFHDFNEFLSHKATHSMMADHNYSSAPSKQLSCFLLIIYIHCICVALAIVCGIVLCGMAKHQYCLLDCTPEELSNPVVKRESDGSKSNSLSRLSNGSVGKDSSALSAKTEDGPVLRPPRASDRVGTNSFSCLPST